MKTIEDSKQGQEFTEGFMNCFLWQRVMKTTRYRSQQAANILDLSMTNEEAMIEHIDYSDPIGKVIICACSGS